MENISQRVNNLLINSRDLPVKKSLIESASFKNLALGVILLAGSSLASYYGVNAIIAYSTSACIRIAFGAKYIHDTALYYLQKNKISNPEILAEFKDNTSDGALMSLRMHFLGNKELFKKIFSKADAKYFRSLHVDPEKKAIVNRALSLLIAPIALYIDYKTISDTLLQNLTSEIIKSPKRHEIEKQLNAIGTPTANRILIEIQANEKEMHDIDSTRIY